MDIDIKKIIVSDAFAYGKSEKKKKKQKKTTDVEYFIRCETDN